MRKIYARLEGGGDLWRRCGIFRRLVRRKTQLEGEDNGAETPERGGMEFVEETLRRSVCGQVSETKHFKYQLKDTILLFFYHISYPIFKKK